VPPRAIGPYEILAVIGRGGIGTVYRARHTRTGELAAVKLLGPGPALDPIAARRLAREFETLQELDHPNVVRVFDAGVAEGYPYIAMELVEGLDLRSYLSPTLDDSIPVATPKNLFAPLITDESRSLSQSGEGPRLAPFDVDAMRQEPDTGSVDFLPKRHAGGASAIRAFAGVIDEPDTDMSISQPWNELDLQNELEKMGALTHEHGPVLTPELLAAMNRPARMSRLKESLTQVCEALSYVHGKGLVHRDLKPTNIMVDDDRRTKLMDFGLVKMVADENTLTATGRIVGTYRYMSPEQAMGERVDARADLYSLGVILYELLSGQPPFEAKSPLDLYAQVVEKDPTPLGTLNPDVDYILARIAHRLLRKAPEERYQTAEEVLEALTE
jgi:serine/threonine protein kinase